MLTVKSLFEATVIVPADSQGPYVVDAGSPVLLSAGNTHADATYRWELGDGAVATTPTVTHTFVESGIYLAKLKVVVNQPGGATSRHFAVVNVRNVPPVVEAGADRTVNEGDLVAFSGSFTDVEYQDTHEAVWDWGDYQKPDAGIVNETNNPPQAQGTITGSHAWGDNGTYTVTLTVRDDDGGVGRDTLTVTVLNVPPTVDAGPDLFAYPCTVLTLTARFADPGWLDTHTGTWEFGDCTPPQPAVIRETNDPPKGVGVAIASHVYSQCGTYPALCTVVDDDGGVGTGTAIIRVVDVQNKGFEEGFRERAAGAVGNAWEPYQAEIPVFGAKPPVELDVAAAPTVFHAEEYIVHDGQRSQRIRFEDRTRFGIRQQVGANAGWDYQITAWYSLAERSGGIARLGIDPTGGKDPTASTVVWSEGFERLEWRELAVRATAPEDGFLTIFLEGQGDVRQTCDVHFDDVRLIAVQPFCVEKPDEPRPPPGHRETCVDFLDLQPGTELPPVFERKGVVFQASDSGPHHVVDWGLPEGRSKLQLHSDLVIRLPFAAEWVRLTVFVGGKAPLVAVALDATGSVLATATSAPNGRLGVVQLEGKGIVGVGIEAGSRENLLVEICARPDRNGPAKEREPPRETPQPREACLDYTRLAPGAELGASHVQAGFSVEALDRRPRRVVSYGAPAGQTKLELGAGVLVDLPFPADRVRVRGARPGRSPVEVVAVESTGEVAGRAELPLSARQAATVELTGTGIVRVQMSAQDAEATMFELCAFQSRAAHPGEQPG